MFGFTKSNNAQEAQDVGGNTDREGHETLKALQTLEKQLQKRVKKKSARTIEDENKL